MSGPVPGQHQLGMWALPQRMLGDERLRPRGGLRGTTQRQVGVHAVFPRGDPKLVEPNGLGACEVVVGELAVRAPAPERKRSIQQIGGLGGPGRARHRQQVAGRPGEQLVGSQHPPQPGDQAVQRGGRVRRLPVPPQHIRDPINGDDRARVHEQQGEQPTHAR